ncbi:MAG: hypothetical protein KOO63_08050 [Bacteroidales bacterium]|nr:hypothetical protein [Candidatus Latescibacterota bacterium]
MTEKIDKPTREFGMSWDEIADYDKLIIAISVKYTGGDEDLRKDVSQEVRLRLHADRRLDTSRFDPTKKDSAIRNTIRNKVLTVIGSRNLGKSQLSSLEALYAMGLQVDSNYNVVYPDLPNVGPPVDTAEGEEG